MYGFHKLSNPEHGGMSESDKMEYQFYHPYFQKGKPELLKNIKRKVTNTRVVGVNDRDVHTPMDNRSSDVDKVLQDVKDLHGRQSKIDNELGAMREENSVLWRELAILRQKHQKQQQIVNKVDTHHS